MQQFLPNQLHILGFPVSVQLFVLVTSIAPLRAYLYGEGIVSFRHGEENNYRKVKLNFKCITLQPVRRGNRMTLYGREARVPSISEVTSPSTNSWGSELFCLVTCQWNAVFIRPSQDIRKRNEWNYSERSSSAYALMVCRRIGTVEANPRIHNPNTCRRWVISFTRSLIYSPLRIR